jgi:hypothetical protein
MLRGGSTRVRMVDTPPRQDFPMDQVSEILLRLTISERQAQLALREIERVALTREIDDPLTSPDRRPEAMLRRDRSLVEWGEIMTELQDLRECELALMRRAALN